MKKTARALGHAFLFTIVIMLIFITMGMILYFFQTVLGEAVGGLSALILLSLVTTFILFYNED